MFGNKGSLDLMVFLHYHLVKPFCQVKGAKNLGSAHLFQHGVDSGNTVRIWKSYRIQSAVVHHEKDGTIFLRDGEGR